jgi:hypothetical protein
MTVTLTVLLPKFGKNSLSHSFPLDAEVSAIAALALETYPDLPKVLEIYTVNDQRQYTLVDPDEPISSLDLKPQQQFIVMPESYDLTFIDSQTAKEHRVRIYNTFTLADVMKNVCVKNQLLEPRFYSVLAGTKELNNDDPITEQAPFVSSVTFQLASAQTIYDFLRMDFLNGAITCSAKDMHFIIASMLHVESGSSKSAARQVFEKDPKAWIPKSFAGDQGIVKSIVKEVLALLKKVKLEKPIQETIDYIMKLQHFGAIVSNGERQLGPIGKAGAKEKVTYSLKFACLQIYKQGGTVLLEQYNLVEMQALGMDGQHIIKFEYDFPERGGRHAVRCRADDAKVLFDAIVDHLRPPKRERGRGSGSRQSTDVEAVTGAIPTYLQSFLALDELPRLELVATVAIASIELIDIASDAVRQFAENPDRREVPAIVQAMVFFVRIVNKEAAAELTATWEEIQGLVGKSGREAKRDMGLRADRFFGILLRTRLLIEGRVNDPSALPVRLVFVELLRGTALLLLTALWIHDRVPCPGLVDSIKASLKPLLASSSDISVYTGDYAPVSDEAKQVIQATAELAKFAARSDREKAPILGLLGRSEKLLKDGLHSVDTYFGQAEPFQLISRLSNQDVCTGSLSDPRAPIKRAQEIVDRLSSDEIGDIASALGDLSSLRTIIVLLLSISQPDVHEQLMGSFNAFVADVERCYATNGAITANSSARRCYVAFDGVLTSMNPAPDLARMLQGYPPEDPRVTGLTPIIAYLDENGPLFNGSPSHINIQRFIGQMSTGDTSALIELAYAIETYVPEEYRQLVATCDRTRDLYPEVDQELDLEKLAFAAENAAKTVSGAAADFRDALRKQEREVVAQYRALSLRLWRILFLFSNFISEESPGSVGFTAFGQCRDAFKILIEEAAYDMRRGRADAPFIDEFTRLVDGVIAAPHDSTALAELGKFFVRHQTRPGFFRAARALSEFNHFVIVLDSNRAAQDLQERLLLGQKFRTTSLMIAALKRRLQTLLGKTELALKTKTTGARREGRLVVDLRRDFHSFLAKWSEELFAIFNQLIVARCTNHAAVQALSVGVDAVEKLFPVVINVEPPAPYLGRSVCGIAFSSMELLTEESTRLNGKAAQSASLAFLAVREFLFNIRRKTAEVEQESSIWKTGIGIVDMYAVIERDNKAMKKQVEFQRAVRRHEWFQHPPIVVPES